MRKFQFGSMLMAGLLALVVLVPSSYAVVLNPGDTGLAPDIFAANGGVDNGAPIVNDTGVQVFTGVDARGNTQYTGNFRQIVVRDTVTNLLDFVYEIEVTNGPSAVDRLTTINFAGTNTDVGYCSNCPDVITLNSLGDGNIVPNTVDRSSDGNVIGFNFTGGVHAGGDTFALVIKTNASFADFTGSTTVLDGGIAAVNSYNPVPEPMNAGLLLGGLFGVGLFVARKFQVRQS